jgi:hypothetical protein
MASYEETNWQAALVRLLDALTEIAKVGAQLMKRELKP